MTPYIRVRVSYADSMTEEVCLAYCEYHRLDPKKRREVAEHFRSSLTQVGQMGVDEQIHEGRQALDYRREEAE